MTKAEFDAYSKRKQKKILHSMVNVTLDSMKDIFASVMDLILLKKDQLTELERRAQEFAERCGDVVDADDPDQVAEDLEGIEDRAKKAAEDLAFARIRDPGERARMQFAATYSDEWMMTPAGNGMRTFFVCLAGVGRDWNGKLMQCKTLTANADWKRLHEDPLAYHQRWYCPVCTARYATKFGLLVELVQNGRPIYLRTTFPCRDVQDLKNMMVERSYGQNVTTAAELLQKIPAVSPLAQDLLRPVDGKPGSYDFNNETFEKMQEFRWESFFEMLVQ